MDNNKRKLDQYASSEVLKDIEENEREIENIKRTLRDTEREYYSVYNEEVLANMFYFEMKDYIAEKDKTVVAEEDKRVDEAKYKCNMLECNVSQF